MLALLLAACSGTTPDPTLSEAAARGKTAWVQNCTACHAVDPAKDGPVGPAVKGSSRELLEARVMRAEYPPGYTPKRSSRSMQPMPHLKDAIDDLAEYIK